MKKQKNKLITSSTAEYFAKNLQQVGFSSQTKSVLTTLKEAIDNALDACEESRILPEIRVSLEKIGKGSLRNSDQICIEIEDNGPGIELRNIARVFGEYLASSKFGQGRCSRGQQGIGISAATTWAQLTSGKGVHVKTKTAKMKKAVSGIVKVDIKRNRGQLGEKKFFTWDRAHGTWIQFFIDGRIQLNGEGGILNYLNATSLVNPHLSLHFKLPETQWQTLLRVSEEVPVIPEATAPHPHPMKLGEFITHSHLFGRIRTAEWLKRGFSRVHAGVLNELVQQNLSPVILNKTVNSLTQNQLKECFSTLQAIKLMAPSTQSVLAIGEESLAKSMKRLGDIDFFAVISRKPVICDFKPVQVEVAVARLNQKENAEANTQVLRFANRVPLQFDKSACAIVHAIESVNWRSYGLTQSRGCIPQGPYVIAVSVVSPFIQFKNASKETIDGSDELVEEIRKALIQAGQKLSRHLRREKKANELEEKIRRIEQFCPILIDGLCRLTQASKVRKKRAELGLLKVLGRDTQAAQKEFINAEAILHQKTKKMNVSA